MSEAEWQGLLCPGSQPSPQASLKLLKPMGLCGRHSFLMSSGQRLCTDSGSDVSTLRACKTVKKDTDNSQPSVVD